MKKNIMLHGLLIALLFNIQCGIIEPEQPYGSVNIILHHPITENSLSKINASADYSTVQCIVKKGEETIYNNNLTKTSDGGFRGEITDLVPSDNYSVLLYGKNTADNIISRGYKDGVRVTAGQQTSVTITWENFTPSLLTPADGSSISAAKPAFNWTPVSGAIVYELELYPDNASTVPAFSKSNLTTTSYTAEYPLTDGTYFWHVRCQDAENNWGEWSSVFRFAVAQNYSLQISIIPDGAGVVTIVPNKSLYVSGEQVTLTARANTGYLFLRWGGNATGTTPTTIVTMDSNKQITAFFDRITPENYVAYYPFDGNAADASGNGYDGTVYGASLVEDRFNRPFSAYKFDGINDYIRLNTSELLKTDDTNTLSFWVKSSDINYGKIMSNKGEKSSVDIDIQTRGEIAYHMFDGNSFTGVNGVNGNTSIRDGQWHHIVVLKRQTTIQLYVDGKVDCDPKALNVQNCDEGNALEFGRSGRNGGEFYFSGLLDDVRIYDFILSEEDILALYQEGGWSGK